MHRFGGRMWMADVFEHEFRTWPNIAFLTAAPDRAHQPPRLIQGPLAGGKSREGIAEHVRAWETQHIHRLGAHDHGLSRIQPPRHSDHDLADSSRPETLHQSLHLDLVYLLTAFVSSRRVAGNIGNAVV